MPDDLSINGFKCTTSEIKEAIKKAGLTKAETKLLDRNNDKTISEDELVDIKLEDDDDKKNKTSSNTDYSDDTTISSLEKQKEKEEKEKARLEYRLTSLRRQRSEAKSRLSTCVEDSKAYERAQEAVDRIQGEIDSVNSEITSCLNNIANLSIEITNAINQYEAKKIAEQQALEAANNQANQAAVSNSANQAAVSNSANANNVNGVNQTSNINAKAGSGSKLAGVTGELSACLDNVAKSLGKSRQEAADYITTLCSTVGKGYFDPKVILSQVFSESSGNQSVTTTGTSAFVGLGQMSSVAVQEVNKQFGTNFSFKDMDNPAKNLEAMVYLMRFQYERYGHNLGAALTAYNVGHYSGSVNGYAQKIMSRAAG